MIKKKFTSYKLKKSKDLGLLKKVRKQERGDFWFLKLFWEGWELWKKVGELVIKKTFTINEKK